MPTFRGGFGQRAYNSQASSLGNLTGVCSQSGTPVSGGKVYLTDGFGVTTQATPNGSGVYSFNGYTAGGYTVTNHPPYDKSIADAGSFAVTIIANQTVTRNFSIQSAVYYNDFSTFSTNGNFTHVGGAYVAGDYFKSAPSSVAQVTINSGGAIVCDLTGGVSGGPAMRYNFPGQPANLTDYYITSQPEMNPVNITDFPNVYWLFCSKEGATQWEHGASAAIAARAYKFAELTFDHNSGSNDRLGCYLEDGFNGALSTRIFCDWVDRTLGVQNYVNNGAQTVLGDGHTYGGVHNTWLIELLNPFTSSATFNFYLNGVRISTLSNTMFNGLTGQVSIGYAHGNNINNGPDNAQSRWFSRCGIYTSRPSLVPF